MKYIIFDIRLNATSFGNAITGGNELLPARLAEYLDDYSDIVPIITQFTRAWNYTTVGTDNKESILDATAAFSRALSGIGLSYNVSDPTYVAIYDSFGRKIGHLANGFILRGNSPITGRYSTGGGTLELIGSAALSIVTEAE